MNNNHQMKGTTLRKLAHLMVGGENEQTLKTAHDFIIEQVLLEKGKQKCITDIRNGIEEIFLLKFRKEEVFESIERLKSRDRVIENLNRYTLELGREGELKKLNSESKSLFEKPFLLYN